MQFRDAFSRIVSAAQRSQVLLMSKPAVLVTGASGHLGQRVLELLLGTPTIGRIIATTRKPDTLAAFAARGVEVRRVDFDDEASLAPAFAGADRALLISTDSVDGTNRRVVQHTAAIRAFERAGVAHVVYTSAPLAPTIGFIADHRATEAALAGSRLDHTILRNNFYLDLLLASLPAAIASGQVADARGDGAAGFVSREDCARAAAAALVEGATGRRTLEITGPALVTSRDVARVASELTGKSIQHVSIPVEALVQGMIAHGLPAPLAAAYAQIDTAIARGELAVQSDAVQRLTGTPPQSLKAFLTANRAALGG
jgi:NAD(P)H dehydrogenase (quinone)